MLRKKKFLPNQSCILTDVFIHDTLTKDKVHSIFKV